MPRIDLTGQKFGKLTVLGYAGGRKWHCKCICGVKKDVYYQHLVSGSTTSCGCNRKGVNANDLTNRRYGLLTALYPTSKRSGNSVVWHCLCECGNTCDVSAMLLRNGSTMSCGCLASKVHSKSIQVAISKRNAYYDYNTDLLNLPIKKPSKNNTSGYRGVSYDVSTGVWAARITFQGRRYFLGASKYKDIAISLRKSAEQQLVGDFLTWYSRDRSSLVDDLLKKYAKN